MSMVNLQASIFYSTIPINQQGFDWHLKKFNIHTTFIITHVSSFFFSITLKISDNKEEEEEEEVITRLSCGFFL